jgi:hypothetical protein
VSHRVRDAIGAEDFLKSLEDRVHDAQRKPKRRRG